jgi:hypothetical protein
LTFVGERDARHRATVSNSNADLAASGKPQDLQAYEEVWLSSWLLMPVRMWDTSCADGAQLKSDEHSLHSPCRLEIPVTPALARDLLSSYWRSPTLSDGGGKMRKITLVLLGLTLLVGLPQVSGREDPDKKKVQELMHRKLQHSEKVLEGIALNDFDRIAKHAEELITLSKLVEFRVLKTPRYELYSADFQRAAEGLIKNAKDKNLDAATLTYLDLTLTCVKCHKHVREVRMVRLED